MLCFAGNERSGIGSPLADSCWGFSAAAAYKNLTTSRGDFSVHYTTALQHFAAEPWIEDGSLAPSPNQISPADGLRFRGKLRVS